MLAAFPALRIFSLPGRRRLQPSPSAMQLRQLRQRQRLSKKQQICWLRRRLLLPPRLLGRVSPWPLRVRCMCISTHIITTHTSDMAVPTSTRLACLRLQPLLRLLSLHPPQWILRHTTRTHTRIHMRTRDMCCLTSPCHQPMLIYTGPGRWCGSTSNVRCVWC